MSNEVNGGAPASMMSLFNVAAANNVSVEQLASALRHQHQNRLSSAPVQFHPATEPPPPMTEPPRTTVTAATTATTTTTAKPTMPAAAYFPEVPEQPVTKKITIKPYKSKYSGTQHKVMNAPKEYYPVAYEKNFDDNFVSKVDLPDTSFNCGEQKHFPGLYGDEDLGCMVSNGATVGLRLFHSYPFFFLNVGFRIFFFG